MSSSQIKRIKLGMVGGGEGAFIGDVHRRAALLDGGVELVAGAFSADKTKAAEKGRRLLLAPKLLQHHAVCQTRRCATTS